MRRAGTIIGSLILLAAIGVGGWWAIDRFAEDEETPEADDEVELVAVPVVRTDLVDRETLDGTLRYGDPGQLVTRLPGTITMLPDVGDVLARGDTAFEIDGEPVVVMFGRRPAWRTLADGIDDGPDVVQLEANLILLGYGDEDFDADEEFTDVTADLVSEWQADLEVDDDGVVDLGRVVFLPTAVRVADLVLDVGGVVAAGSPVLQTSSTQRQVQVWLDADRQDLLDIGDRVDVELPDERRTTGTVAEVGDVVTTLGTGPEARRVIEVTIRLDDASVVGDLNEAPVDVEVVSEEATDVLALPVDALLALAEGGYAVQVPDADGTSRFVAVDIGAFADGLVEVTGDIAEGDLVLVPR
jgi:hypothetical protein